MQGTTESAWYALHEPLHHFIRQRVATEEQAEDLLQEVFLKIHTQIDTLREHKKLESWIYQIARHLIIDQYRQKRQDIPLEEAEPLLPLEEIPEEDIRAELAPSVAAMINCLPSPYREALFLTEYQGISQKDLAERLGMSFSGAKSRVQRAREKLKQLLLDCCHFEFDRLGRVIDYYPHCACCQGSADGCCTSDHNTCNAGKTDTFTNVVLQPFPSPQKTHREK